MDPRKLLESLRERKITITAKDDYLVVQSRDGVLTDQDREYIRRHKPALLKLLWTPTWKSRPQELAEWPIPWREAWGRLANEFHEVAEAGGMPAQWWEVEMLAYCQLSWRKEDEQSAEQALEAVREELGLTSDQSNVAPEHWSSANSEEEAEAGRSLGNTANPRTPWKRGSFRGPDSPIEEICRKRLISKG